MSKSLAEASPDVSRAVHAAAIQLKRHELWMALACVGAIAALAFVSGRIAPLRDLFQVVILVAFVVASYAAKVAVSLVKLYRTDPAQTLRLEYVEEVERRAEITEHSERSAAVTPFVTYGLLALIGVVTAVQFFVAGQRSFELAALIKPAVREGAWWRLLTASYLHANVPHLLANMSGLRLLGGMVETYDRRSRVALVFLTSAIGGNVASSFLLSASAVGASGGILGLAGYLVVVGARQPDGAPSWLRKRMLAIVGTTALYGIIGFFFIDNAAHAGGALTGFIVGLATVPRPRASRSPRAQSSVDACSWLSAAGLVAGAWFTIARLIQ